MQTTLTDSGKYTRAYYRRNRELILNKMREKRVANRTVYLERIAAYRENNRESLNEKRRLYVEAYPDRVRETRKKYYQRHRKQRVEAAILHMNKMLTVPALRIKYLSRQCVLRAKRMGRIYADNFCDRFIADPPANCACCACELDYSRGNGKNKGVYPSIDRIDNTLGYVADNVAVVCRKCNTNKSNLSLAELRRLVAYVERCIPKEQAQ